MKDWIIDNHLEGNGDYKKERVMGHKINIKKYELKQLLTYKMQLLKYNLMKNNVEGICNVYL
jgi:tRNA G10  N-methylase Trm11